jgi:leucyl-tRNA synthetase
MTTATPNFDHLAERIRERVMESDDASPRRYCANCEGSLTEDDIDNGQCSQCGDGVPDVDDESADEHLWE